MVLEVIEQNTAGIKLYQKVGFKTVRRLVGFKLEHPQVEPGAELEEIDIRELAHLVTLHGGKDWPWQLSGESIALVTPPPRLPFERCLLFRRRPRGGACGDLISVRERVWMEQAQAQI